MVNGGALRDVAVPYLMAEDLESVGGSIAQALNVIRAVGSHREVMVLGLKGLKGVTPEY